MSDTVSVVLPSYNHARYVALTLESVLAQTRPPDEIVVVDDGSTDGTPEVVARYAPRVRLVARAHAGIAPTYDACVAEGHGAWLAFVETDDVLEPTYLEDVLRFAAAHPAFAWISTARRIIDADGRPTGDLQRKRSPGLEFTTASLLETDLGWVSTPVVRRDALLGAGPFDPRTYGVDTEMALRFSLAQRLGFLDVPLYRYRRHAGNTSASALRNATTVLRIVETFGREHPDVAAAHRGAFRRALARYRAAVGALTAEANPAAGRREIARWFLASLRVDPLRPREWKRLVSILALGPAAYARRRARRSVRRRPRG